MWRSLAAMVLLIAVTKAASVLAPKMCVPIPGTQCASVGYNMTFAENDFTQEDADKIMSDFGPLIGTQCSAELKLFLCSVYVPVCAETDGSEGTVELHRVPPCRNLCLRVKEACLPTMTSFHYEWPRALACGNFSKLGDGPMCLDPLENIQKKEPNSNGRSNKAGPRNKFGQAPSNQISSGHHFEEPFFSNGDLNQIFDAVSNTEENKTPGGGGGGGSNCKCSQCGSPERRASNSLISLTPGDPLYDRNVSFGGLENCAAPCRSPHLDAGDVTAMEHVLAFFSTACFIATGVSVFILHTQQENSHSYPRRSAFYFSACYFLVSVGFAVRLLLGHERVACQNLTGQMSDVSVVLQKVGVSSLLGNFTCVAISSLIYYFLMAAAAWWVALTVGWYLSTARAWCPEAFERHNLGGVTYNTCLHLASWLIPMLELILVLAFSAVDGDNVSGICFVGSVNVGNTIAFLAIPLAMKLVVGLIFLSTGVAVICQGKANLPQSVWAKVRVLPARILSFSVPYVALQSVLIGCSLWLYLNNAAWEESVVRRSCLPCRGTDRSALALAPPSLALFGAKHASLLASGLLSLVWTANKRTFEAARGMMAIRTVGEKKERPVPVGENIYEKVQSDANEVFHLANLKVREVIGAPAEPQFGSLQRPGPTLALANGAYQATL